MIEYSKDQKSLTVDVECINCGFPDKGVFCSNCGSHLTNKRISSVNLAGSIIDYFSNFEQRYVKTFVWLTKNPIEFIDQYISGHTERYYIPFKYFLLNLGMHLFVYNYFKINLISQNAFGGGEAEQMLQLKSDEVFDALINNYGSFFSLLIVPLYVYLTKIFFNGSKYNLAERATAITFLLGHLMVYQAALHLIAAVYHPFHLIQKVLILLAEFYIFFILSLKFFKASLIHAIWKSIAITCLTFLSMKFILAFTLDLLRFHYGE